MRRVGRYAPSDRRAALLLARRSRMSLDSKMGLCNVNGFPEELMPFGDFGAIATEAHQKALALFAEECDCDYSVGAASDDTLAVMELIFFVPSYSNYVARCWVQPSSIEIVANYSLHFGLFPSRKTKKVFIQLAGHRSVERILRRVVRLARDAETAARKLGGK